MPKFELGQAVKVVHGEGEPFCGRVAEIHDPGPTFYRVEDEYKGHTYAMTAFLWCLARGIHKLLAMMLS